MTEVGKAELSKPELLAEMIRTLTVDEWLIVRRILEDDYPDGAAALAVLPPNLPLKEDGVALELPEDYWETAG